MTTKDKILTLILIVVFAFALAFATMYFWISYVGLNFKQGALVAVSYAVLNLIVALMVKYLKKQQ